MLGLDYIIQYKKGNENGVADALSRRYEDSSQLLAISAVVPSWLEEVLATYEGDPVAMEWLPKLAMGTEHPKYKLQNGILYFDTKIYVGQGSSLRQDISVTT